MNHLTMQQLEDLGFEAIMMGGQGDYLWESRKHKKHPIWIQTTWKKSGVFHSQEIKCDFVDLEILKTKLK
jgi:hypothetical protein